MAYKRQITRECIESCCSAPAKWEVFSRRNSPYGIFCRIHADRRVDNLRAEERRSDEAREAVGDE